MKNDTHTQAELSEKQKKKAFVKKLLQSDNPTIARFLGVDLNDLAALTLNKAIATEYDEMSEHEVDEFEREMTADSQAKNRLPLNVLPLDQFTEYIRTAGVDSLMRFLAVSKDELLELSLKEQVVDRIAETHAQMPDDDIAAFEREILHTIRRERENAPIWTRIHHDHHEETDGFIVGYVDAWLTNQEDEEGRVIAQVVGAIIDGKPAVYVAHCDPEARFDANAKAAVAECTKKIIEALNKTLLSGQADIRRRVLTEGKTRTFQVLAWIPDRANGECFAQVTIVSDVVDGESIHSLPQVELFIPPGLGMDITHRVNELVTEFLQEIKAERAN